MSSVYVKFICNDYNQFKVIKQESVGVDHWKNGFFLFSQHSFFGNLKAVSTWWTLALELCGAFHLIGLML